ncbi:NUDIX hydrolase [Nocardioides sp. zg-1308]|uniref:NUDIX domain-containing protein n=1 Tax=Nocardioides TaxID=1839 RepID=UPI001557934C|nr:MULTISPECIES: NUDIX hydrolase [unclassified Nocardioides]NPD05976.1 NUDIX hydrolase [Nocardioides sp. zg-1308]WQQ20495.1 NUDIX hydrolase [Nocardioides sp. S-34]
MPDETDLTAPAQPLADRPMTWPVVSSRDLHRDDWVVALREDVITRPGHPEQFSRLSLEHPGAVIVLAVDDDEQVVCLRQYRHTSGYEFVELPAGLRDAGDEPAVETAKRELREEVELEASDWRPLLSTFSSAGISDEVHEIFLARGLTPASRGDFEMHHEEAEMETFRVPMSELLDAALEGRVRQGPLVQAVLAYEVLRQRGTLDAS